MEMEVMYEDYWSPRLVLYEDQRKPLIGPDIQNITLYVDSNRCRVGQ